MARRMLPIILRKEMRKLFFIIFVLSTFRLLAQTNDSVQSLHLNEVEIIKHTQKNIFNGSVSEGITLDSYSLSKLPTMIGETDPLKAIQLLPDMAIKSEYQGGVNVRGGENYHNKISIRNVPVYNSSHLLGFYSTFNLYHFRGIDISYSNHIAHNGNFLGSGINFTPIDTLANRFALKAELGMLDSQLHIQLPISDKMSGYISARRSYINLLYGGLLDGKHMGLNYDFSDINATFVLQPNLKNKIYLDFFHSKDKANMTDKTNNAANYEMQWDNTLFSLNLEHLLTKDKYINSQMALSRYASKNWADFFSLKASLIANISDLSYKWYFNINRDYYKLLFGSEHKLYIIQPQTPTLPEQLKKDISLVSKENNLENSIFIDCSSRLINGVQVSAGMRGSAYRHKDYSTYALDPKAEISFRKNKFGKIAIQADIAHQFLHQSGFTNSGYPTEYWFGATRYLRAEASNNISLNYVSPTLYGISLQINAYNSHLFNQTEYSNDLLDVLLGEKDDTNIKMGDGTAKGLSAMLIMSTGKLTGWLSYTYTHSRRKFIDNQESYKYPPKHERPNEFCGVASYNSKKVTYSCMLILASGTPFTPPSSTQFIGNTQVTSYGKYNSGRLPSYFRMDAGVSYLVATGLTLKLSVYNMTAHRNALNVRYLKEKKQLREETFLINMLPSLSILYKI